MPSNASLSAKSSARPSLLAGGCQAGRAGDGEPSGFGLSILSAAREDHRPEVMVRASSGPSHGKKRLANGLWLLGTAAVALALVGLSQWRTQVPPAAPAVAAPADQAKPAQVVQVAQVVSQPASATAATAVASAPPAAPPVPAAETVAPGAALRALPVARPVVPTKPVKPPAKDPDAELVAAVMAHSDTPRRQAPPKPKPLSDVQRFQFAMELKRCRVLPNQTTQDACVVAACESKAYWGRTRSCPLPPEPVPPRTRAAAAGPVDRG